MFWNKYGMVIPIRRTAAQAGISKLLIYLIKLSIRYPLARVWRLNGTAMKGNSKSNTWKSWFNASLARNGSRNRLTRDDREVNTQVEYKGVDSNLSIHILQSNRSDSTPQSRPSARWKRSRKKENMAIQPSCYYLEFPQKPGIQVSMAFSSRATPGILKHKPADRYLSNAHALVQIRDRGWHTAFIQRAKNTFNRMSRFITRKMLLIQALDVSARFARM